MISFAQKLFILHVTIDGQLSCDDHITDIVRACNYHIRALRHICPLIKRDTANTVACSMVFSILDYCNVILYDFSDQNISRLQRVQNSLARVVCQAPYRSSATHMPRVLHWLPVRQRIECNLASLTFKVRLHHEPIYLSELVVDHVPTRSMCSSDKVLPVVPRMKTVTASRAFRVAALKTWNSLPLEIRSITFTRTFHQRLKHICSTVHIINWSGNGASVAVPGRMLDFLKCTYLGRRLTINFD